jgi:uridine kinase
VLLENDDRQRSFLIGVVGGCASGKSTLIRGLEARGYHARHIAQEHSYVKNMWKRITNPDVLIFLDVSYVMTIKRRQLNWGETDWQEQQRRLIDAREHADLTIQTDQRNEGEVLDEVIRFLRNFLAKGQFYTTPHP